MNRGCRKRKIRCDGSKPSCISCQVIYRQDCVYDVLPSALDAAQLSKEVAELRDLLSTLVTSDQDDRNRLLSAYSTRQPNAVGKGSPTPAVAAGTSSAVESSAQKTGASRVAKRPAESIPADDLYSQEDERAAALLSELSFAASGQVEHFGATSFLVSI